MRLVLDTSVLVAALRSGTGASRRLVVAALSGHVTVLVSVPLMLEYEAVLTRAEHLDASGITIADVEAVLDAYAAVAEPVRIAFLWRPQLRDPADDMVLETGVNGRAEGLVTFNERDFQSSMSNFGIAILSPLNAVRRLGL